VLADARLTIVSLRELFGCLPPATVQGRVICGVHHSCRAEAYTKRHDTAQHSDRTHHLKTPLWNVESSESSLLLENNPPQSRQQMIGRIIPPLSFLSKFYPKEHANLTMELNENNGHTYMELNQNNRRSSRRRCETASGRLMVALGDLG
jgi:hypothetical protein